MKTIPHGVVSVLFGLSCSLLMGCGIQPPPGIAPGKPNVVSLDPKNWYIYYSSGTPAHPGTDSEGAWSFAFPNSGHVNYIQTPFNVTSTLHNVTLTFKVESDAPLYGIVDPSDILPATVHIFFEQRNDNLIQPDGRWWAGASAYNLGSEDNTTITQVVPLTPDQWSDVYGEHDAQSFYAALSNVGWIGVTCGGQYFWGHGVGLDSGSAKYVLINVQVN
jgi:hypothetical protein